MHEVSHDMNIQSFVKSLLSIRLFHPVCNGWNKVCSNYVVHIHMTRFVAGIALTEHEASHAVQLNMTRKRPGNQGTSANSSSHDESRWRLKELTEGAGTMGVGSLFQHLTTRIEEDDFLRRR